jgi:hypothetical protein
MAKAPIPGYAKTRMIPALGEDGAAQLQQTLTQQLIERLSTELKINLWCAPDIHHPFFQALSDYPNIQLYSQVEADLGERMYVALQHGLEHNQFAIVVGTDIPSMDLNMIKKSIAALEEGHDAVILPIDDGGYGLLGIKQNHRKLFENIEWSTTRAYQQTVQRFKDLQWHYYELPVTWDLDEPEDLKKIDFVKS